MLLRRRQKRLRPFNSFTVHAHVHAYAYAHAHAHAHALHAPTAPQTWALRRPDTKQDRRRENTGKFF